MNIENTYIHDKRNNQNNNNHFYIRMMIEGWKNYLFHVPPKFQLEKSQNDTLLNQHNTNVSWTLIDPSFELGRCSYRERNKTNISENLSFLIIIVISSKNSTNTFQQLFRVISITISSMYLVPLLGYPLLFPYVIF